MLLAIHAHELRSLSVPELLDVLGAGLRLDGVVVGYLLMPAILLLLLPRRMGRRALGVYTASILCLIVFSAVAELRFFEYYGFRPNYLILEHGADREVLRTVVSRYATPAVLVCALGLAVLVLLLHRRLAALLERLPQVFSPPAQGAYRWLAPLCLLLLGALLARGSLDHRPLNASVAAVTTDRRANEIGGSGLLNVAYEVAQRAQGRYVRLASVHSLLPRDEAFERVRRLLSGQGRFTNDSPSPFVRVVGHAATSDRPLNVVLVVMESFTGRLVGALGGRPALSPELDALSREGLLLTHCYATGERTVQGLEAVVSSFPPLPGVGVIRRPQAQHGFATLADVLAHRGYDSIFLYGGQGIFDRMRSFFLGNGFSVFIEERDFQNVSFRGSWGVSDGDLFRRANREFQNRWEQGKPFFATLLTVSLHSPWEFPREHVPPLPADTVVPSAFEREELANFLYADYAVGEFIRNARRQPYFMDTLFVFVGDHGVHLRGSALLPSEEYRVPVLFYAPGRISAGRIDGVTSQLDVAPTILGILGGEHRSPFFGRDVRGSPASDGLAILIYNKRRYGARRDDRLTVLAEDGRRAAYRILGDGQALGVPVSPAHEEDARDALAVVQVAEDLVLSGRYTAESAPGVQPTEARTAHVFAP